MKLNSGFNPEALLEFESGLDFRLDYDFKEYLSKVNGFVDYTSDPDFFSFWSVERMQEPIYAGAPELLCFADYFISLQYFGYSKEDGKIYSFFQFQKELCPIADNFTEFIKMYLKDPFKLLM